MDSANAAPALNAPLDQRRRPNEPDNFAGLNPDDTPKEKKSWDEFIKNKKKTEAYSTKTVKSDYRKKYKPNKYEKETDAMFAGSGNKRKRKNKKKKQKVLLQTAVHYGQKKSGGGGDSRGRGRGRGGGGGGYNNMRGGG